jgi:enamine deaminase RidA (YjgF/YER057c/UK114 family)
MSTPTERLAGLGLELPEVLPPVAKYVPALRHGDLVFASGQTPTVAGKLTVTGKLGADVTVEGGQLAARLCALNCLAAAAATAGGLDNITQVVKLTGYVASADGFTEQPAVINGASQLLEEVFGDAGRHARAALGLAELPGGAPVEVELIVAVR